MQKEKYVLFIGLIFIMMTSCKAQKNTLLTNIERTGNTGVIQDSFINELRNKNEIIIAYAVENFAWSKSIDYRIIVQHNETWKGYEYKVNLMQQNPSHTITLINVSKAACDSIINYLNENKVWDIKGDSGESFCADNSNKCNINDATTARLWIITKNKLINPSYYAPAFFEKCCPEKNRSLFISITSKIENTISNHNG